MGLGLDKLTDDQLVDLLQEACAELGMREHTVRTAAQRVICEEAEKFQACKEGLERALAKAKAEYLTGLRKEIEAEVRDAVKRGEIRLLPQEEAKAVVQATLESKVQLLDEAIAQLQNPARTSERFFVEVRDDLVTVSYGNRRVQSRHKLSAAEVKDMAEKLRPLLA